ncbi:MAG: hypothetical protein H7A51_01745 [Akkermansiaceae bacterium]|nr:hypothetical protein [Akkermansiaceae bacterium]
MKRSYNYTGRKRLNNKDFTISRFEVGSAYEFMLSFHTHENYNFPNDSSVKVEAYVNSNTERFSLGTWGSPDTEKRIPITLFDTSEEVKFRLKIVDESKPEKPLIAWKDSISPISYDGSGNRRKGILPVRAMDLGHRLWKLEWNDLSPRLLVNSRVSETKDINAIVRADPDFAGLVFPAVLEEILIILAKNEALAEDDDSWAKFSKQFAPCAPPVHDPDSDESDREIEEWAETTIQNFCSHFDIVQNYKLFKSNTP